MPFALPLRRLHVIALRVLVLLALVFVCFGGAGARAQVAVDESADLGRARSLFQRGVELATQGDYAGAAKRFREALDVHYAPAIAYNLASALSELGQSAEAYDFLQSALRDPTTPEALRVRARRLEDSLQRLVARLTVVVSSEESNLTILVDGTPLAPQLVGVSRAVPPGDHVVLAERAGVRISERSVRIPTGTAALVDMSLVMTPRQAAEAVPEASGAPSAPPLLTSSPVSAGPRDDLGDGKRRRRYWIIGGAGVVAVGASVLLAVLLAKPDKHTESAVAGNGMPGVLVWK